MNPQEQFCHNRECHAYGRKGEGHIVIHSQKEKRYRCKRCRATFSRGKGSALYRLHKPHELFLLVLTLLAHGCPLQAIVAAFGLDERTVARWQKEAGGQCKRVHEHLVEAGRVELSQGDRPMSCACGWLEELCGWLRLWRLEAGCGWAVP